MLPRSAWICCSSESFSASYFSWDRIFLSSALASLVSSERIMPWSTKRIPPRISAPTRAAKSSNFHCRRSSFRSSGIYILFFSGCSIFRIFLPFRKRDILPHYYPLLYPILTAMSTNLRIHPLFCVSRNTPEIAAFVHPAADCGGFRLTAGDFTFILCLEVCAQEEIQA